MAHAKDNLGRYQFLASINEEFEDADALDNGASKVLWKWADAGIACISSWDPEFNLKFKGNAITSNVNFVVQDKYRPAVTEDEKQPVPPESEDENLPYSGDFEPGHTADFNAYGRNIQWGLISMGCVTLNNAGVRGGAIVLNESGNSQPEEGDPIYPWDPPTWVANYEAGVPLEGSGIVIAALSQIPCDLTDYNSSTGEGAVLHPECCLYRQFNKVGAIDINTSVADAVFEEEHADVDPHGGVIGYDLDYSVKKASATAWDAGIAYVLDDVVTSGGTEYICISANTNQVPPNATYWTILAAVKQYYMLDTYSTTGEDTTGVGILASRGVGICTYSTTGEEYDGDGGGKGTAGDAFDRKFEGHIPGSKIPTMDGLSYLKSDATYNQIGPFEALKGRCKGLAPRAKIICYTAGGIISEGGFAGVQGKKFFDSYILWSMKKAIDHNCHIFQFGSSRLINGIPGMPIPGFAGMQFVELTDEEIEIYKKAIQQMKVANIVMVSSNSKLTIEMNETEDIFKGNFPSEFPHCITVGRVAPRDYRALSPKLNAQ